MARALDLAEEEARQRGHAAIGTDDLLLGLVREGTNVAAKVLERFGVTLAGDPRAGDPPRRGGS